MTNKKQISFDSIHSILACIHRLSQEHGEAKSQLIYSNPIELLIAVILSAQCTDIRVNIITKSLFLKYPTLEHYIQANPKKFEQDIFSSGYYRSKTKNILQTCKLLKTKFNGKVPDSMSELLSLPGVARKTANVVLAEAFGITQGIVVDTHVRRLSIRLGWSSQKNPLGIERDLMKKIPKKFWIVTGNTLIRHGRVTCTAKKPACTKCILHHGCKMGSTQSMTT